MNNDARTLNRTLAHQSQQHGKGSHTTTTRDLPQERKDGSTYVSPLMEHSNKMKVKIVSTDAEKAFDNIHHFFLIKHSTR